jgi:hypothetical protein
LKIIGKELTGLIFSIVFFILVAISAFYIWFRDGANKSSRAALKFFNENAPGSVSRFDEITQHPLVWKVGSIIMLFVSLLCLYLAFVSLRSMSLR